MLGLIRALPLILAVSGLAYGYHYVTVKNLNDQIADLKQEVATLRTHNGALQTAAEINQQTITGLEADLVKQREDFGKLSEKYSAVESEIASMTRIFSKHNLTYLARQKPGLIEPRINDGTKDVFRQIEQDSKELEDANK